MRDQPEAANESDISSPEVSRVLQALHANRTPGWQLPAYFLGLVFDTSEDELSKVSMPIGSHCTTSDGRVDLAALCVMADVSLAASLRRQAGSAARLVTLTARLSFLALPKGYNLEAHARQRWSDNSATMATAGSSLEMRCDGELVCVGEASFAVLDNRRGTAPHPLPRTDPLQGLVPLQQSELETDELSVFERALSAASAPRSGHAFLESFWQLLPYAHDKGAECVLPVGPQVSNRVGHAHGGVLLGLAARTSVAAAPAGWRLMDISVQYIEVGLGILHAHATALRLGRNIASIDCQVVDAAGTVILRTQANFVRPL